MRQANSERTSEPEGHQTARQASGEGISSCNDRVTDCKSRTYRNRLLLESVPRLDGNHSVSDVRGKGWDVAVDRSPELGRSAGDGGCRRPQEGGRQLPLPLFASVPSPSHLPSRPALFSSFITFLPIMSAARQFFVGGNFKVRHSLLRARGRAPVRGPLFALLQLNVALAYFACGYRTDEPHCT